MTRGLTAWLVVFCISSLLSPCFSQYYFYNDKYFDNDLVFEIGGSVGLMNSITDLGGQAKNKKVYLNEINWKNTTKAAGVYVAAMYQQTLGVRLEATYGSVKGNDSLLAKGSPRYERNLSFRSDIREIALLVEFHPTMLWYREQPPMFSPYVIAGAGWYSFNPQGILDNQWIDLQPLRTEGQGFAEYRDRRPYRLSQPNIGFGAGVKCELQSFNIRLEWVHRYLFTDYLDDVSQSYIEPDLFTKYFSSAKATMATTMYKRGVQNNRNRGEANNTDAYFTINLKAGITLGRTKR